LGAALGYLLSQKSVQKALRDMRPPSVRMEPDEPSVSPPVAAAVMVAEAPVTEAPVVEPPRMPEWEPIPRPTPAYSPVEAPVIEAEAPVVEAPRVEAPEIEAEALVVETPPVETPFTEAFEVEAPVAEAPVVETPVVEPPRMPEWEPTPRPTPAYSPVETPLMEAEASAVEAPSLEEQIVEAPEPEVIVTDEFLEEPLPGAGWEPPAALAVEEKTLEEALPVAPDEFEPYQAAEVERRPVEHREEPPPVAWSESDIEESVVTVEEDVGEFEQAAASSAEQVQPEAPTFDASFFESPVAGAPVAGLPVVEAPAPLESFFEAPVVEAPVADDVSVDVPTVEAGFFEGPVIEAPLAETLETETLETEILEVAPPAAEVLETESARVEVFYEPPIIDVPVVELPVSEPEVLDVHELETPAGELEETEAAFFAEAASVAEVAPVAVEADIISELAPVDDLKARIEETRRRIRQELEQPFVSAGQSEPVDDDWTIAPAMPMVDEEAAIVEPALAEVAESLVADGEGGIDVEFGLEEPVDYDSMKSRIEMTRSRLKAKAFDAMMTGESALLGRDTEDAGKRPKIVPAVDSEVNESIESSLREQED
ncbi:MAG: hypothetical protein JXA87_12665, partial [Thermoleophilia bacterium]|nr:hypothetical protein [Thermoleophilia bacterium]